VRKLLLSVALFTVIAGSVVAFLLLPAKPEYCWLVFGPNANLRVLVRLQGSKVYMDRDGDGQFTRPEESLGRIDECRDIAIAGSDGLGSCTIAQIALVADERRPSRKSLLVDVDIHGLIAYRQYCDVELASTPQSAKVAHFHGPLTVEARKILWILPSDLKLQRGDEPTKVQVVIGTMDAEQGCWVVVRTQAKKDEPVFPKGVHPVVDVEFQPKHQGAPPITRRYALDEPC
jgi:hypothetical protein